MNREGKSYAAALSYSSGMYQNKKEYTTMTGAEFNTKMAGIKMYKLLNPDMEHHGYMYEPGALNDLTKLEEQFDPDPDCGPGGLYFCAESDILRWINGINIGHLIALIEIPADAQISVGYHKFKTDKLILGKPVMCSEFYSDSYLLTVAVHNLWQGCWSNSSSYNLTKRAYVLGPDRFDFESKANLVYLAGVYRDIVFLDSIKEKVRSMLEDSAFRTYLAKTIDVIPVSSREWFGSNFPQHTDLITALNLKNSRHYNFPFGDYSN